jgi:quercetin dioxygenase-like cupin family protein
MSTSTLPFTWDDVKKEQINDLIKRQAIHGDSMTICRMEMQVGAVVGSHSHHNEQISTVQSGSVKFTVDGQDVVMKAGDVLQIHSNRVHSAQALEESIVIETFAPRRDDWIRGDNSYMQKK